MQEFPDHLELQFDGACEPNPGGLAVYGFIVQDKDGKILHKAGGVVRQGEGATNNVAEYCALGFGLKHLLEAGWKGRLSITGDSKLVCFQMTKEWKCNKSHLQGLRARCWQLLSKICPGGCPKIDPVELFHEVTADYRWNIEWVPRERNVQADLMSRMAYECATGKPFPERYRP